ncbi:DUF1840 domain-containing protein [Thiolinea disciformis]|uniref:DUF1840 domain-containing protein n=1 Tax=Thiolinea disciformis TaxID=125614 RepID=UPI00037F9779|nr:DUF1840 domain-containing protein [Thiolinea disciformis]
MLIRFESKAGGGFSMYEEDAKQLLKLMGHSGTIPSAIAGADVASVLKTLENNLAAAAQQAAPNSQDAVEEEENEDGEKKEKISVNRRAYPMLELLKLAAAQKTDVLWFEDRSVF